MLLTTIILPYFTFKGYNRLFHTISKLGAQNAPYAWIMNLAFFILGLSIIFDFLLNIKNKIYLFFSFLIGISFILISFYNNSPIPKEILYNHMENKLHLISAYSTYFISIIFLLLIVLIDKSKIIKLITFFTALNLSTLGIFVYNFKTYIGLFERIILFSSLFWLIIFVEIKRKRDLAK